MKHKELKFIAVFISFILVISILPQPFAKIDVASAQTQKPVYACAELRDPALSVICQETECITSYNSLNAGGQLNSYFNGNPPTGLQDRYDDRSQCITALRTFKEEVNSRNIFVSSGGSSVTVDRARSPLGGSGQTCNDQCFARTSVNSGAGGNIGGAVPIGICSTQELAIATGGLSNVLSGAGTNVGIGVGGQTFSIGKGLQFGCKADEWCLCQRFGVAFNVNNQQNNQQGTTGLQGFNTASVPGTRGFLLDPADITDSAPRKSANDVVCSQVSRVALEADINPKLVPTGTQLTITGAVTKFSNTCDGVQYECRIQYNAGCDVDQGFFKSCIVPRDCSPDVEIPGGKRGPICTTNWVRIIGLALMVVAIATIVFAGPIAGALSGLFTGSGAGGGAAAAAGAVSPTAVALGGLSITSTAGQLIASPTAVPGGGATGTQEGISTPFLGNTDNAIAAQAGDMNTANKLTVYDKDGTPIIISTTQPPSGDTATQAPTLENLQKGTCAALALYPSTTLDENSIECQKAKTLLSEKLQGKDLNDQTLVANAISETIGKVAGARTRSFDVGDRIVLFDKTYERGTDGLWHEVGSNEKDTLLPARNDRFVEYAIQKGDATYQPLDTSPFQQPDNQPPASQGGSFDILGESGSAIASPFGNAYFPLAYAQQICPAGQELGEAGCQPITQPGVSSGGANRCPDYCQFGCETGEGGNLVCKTNVGTQTGSQSEKTKTSSNFTVSESALKTAGLIGTQVGLSMFAQSTPLPQGGCYNICGKNIGRTPVAASPVCPGYPIAASEKTFRCGEQSCGGFEEKDVNIQIKTQEGRVLNTATVTTDANGAFSYTFTAPSTEAVFIAVVTTEGSTSTVATTARTP